MREELLASGFCSADSMFLTEKTAVFGYCPEGDMVLESNGTAFLSARSRGSPVNVVPIRLVT